MTPPTPKEPEAISELRSGLAGSRFEGCGGYGCFNHTWHMEDVLAAYDTLAAERDVQEEKFEQARKLYLETLDRAVKAEAERDAAVQKARYESDVAAQAMAAKDAAVQERDDADDALAACQAQAAGTIAQLRETLDAAERRALNLLAVVHRDGGQHTSIVGFAESCTEAEAVVVALRAQLAEAEEDAARLDWLANHYHHFRVNKPYGGWDFATQKPGVWSWSDTYKPFPTLREALDTALTAATAQGE
jgi:hypothetical protein